MMVTKMIKEIMSKKIISGDIDSSFKDISKLMKENNIGFIPIKDKENFIGVITDRDICIALPEIENLNTSIKDYITNNIIYIDVSASFKEALEQMKKNKIKRLLVKENDKIVGVISLSDIINNYEDKDIIDTCKAIFYIHDNGSEITAEIDEFYL